MAGDCATLLQISLSITLTQIQNQIKITILIFVYKKASEYNLLRTPNQHFHQDYAICAIMADVVVDMFIIVAPNDFTFPHTSDLLNFVYLAYKKTLDH